MRRLLTSVYLVPTIIGIVLTLGFLLWAAPNFVAWLMQDTPWGILFDYEVNPEQVRNLGTELVGGAVVAVAVLLAQVAIDERVRTEREQQDRKFQEDSERKNLYLTLSLEKDLSNIDLRGRDLQRVFLNKKLLRESVLAGANLKGAILLQSDLRKSILTEANLKKAALLRSNLSEATLFGADLSGADLSGATLFGAKLNSVKLFGANLSEAVALRQSRPLSDALIINTFSKAYTEEGVDNTEGASKTPSDGPLYDSKTQWPEGFDPESAGAIYKEEENPGRESQA